MAEILEVPLNHLLNPRNLFEEKWTIRGQEVLVPFYQFNGHTIWGAAAMVLSEFLEKMKGNK